MAEVAGIKADDIFVKIGGEFVLHYNRKFIHVRAPLVRIMITNRPDAKTTDAQLVEKLATQPLSFSVELTDSHQMPKSRGKYLIEICDSISMAMNKV